MHLRSRKEVVTKYIGGLNRCRKSCRLRWLNYLRPNIKRGDFALDEDDLIIRLHRLLGNRQAPFFFSFFFFIFCVWSLIARRIPGRTANDIKNYWNSCLSKKIASEKKNPSNLVNHWTHTSPMNLESSDVEFGYSSFEKKPKREGDAEEEEDTTSFWRSLLLEGEYMETKLKVENKELIRR
ncbi:hypothetical protein L1049_015745 [Liquidambar formosana]|uniref:Uncharacterized protein n=1 Tax=Liquidambar formosana TaxID=63359 RepID=A0AAP0S5D0_LIQFO